jgi:hypothetical protein
MLIGCGNDGIWCDFDPDLRTWYVTPSFFSRLHLECGKDPLWAERQYAAQMGPGPVTIKVTHEQNPVGGRGALSGTAEDQ